MSRSGQERPVRKVMIISFIKEIRMRCGMDCKKFVLSPRVPYSRNKTLSPVLAVGKSSSRKIMMAGNEESKFVPPNMQLLHLLLPDSQLHEVPKPKHVLNYSSLYPWSALDLNLSFVARIPFNQMYSRCRIYHTADLPWL